MKRFWNKVNKTNTCWLWVGYRDRDGYGHIKIDSKSELAHRVAWLLSGCVIPDELQVLHSCDVTFCVNPKHLFIGTNADNVADKVKKQRQSRRAKHGRAVLTEDDVITIRFLREFHRKEFTLKQISEYYGISITHVHQIEYHTRWV
jgi:hypothetical protein